ncbi:hypothetical protein, partial [Saccharomonospora iraqiensis]|uniref:hypothetical protein n=1 Tax=Saccharomonospora iraqiensis TaxID=52698 RepID=UPI002D218BE2
MPLPAFGRGRSKSRAAHTPPHRDDRGSRDDRDASSGAATDKDVDDHELSSYLAALAPETDPESTGSGRRFGEADVHQVRLTPAAGQQLRDLAAERGTSPGALAQEWVLERLAWEDRGAAEAPPAAHVPPAVQSPPAAQAPRDPRAVPYAAAPHEAAPYDAHRSGHP